MIVCTQNDKIFQLYKEKVKNRKVLFTIRQIFLDWWLIFLNSFPHIKIRKVVINNVDRMLKCKTISLGFTCFKCPDCGKEKVLFHSCKSRVCSSCGNKYNKHRENSIFSKLFRFKHRHVVFTIPDELRRFFRKNRKRLHYLFKASQITINFWLKQKYKKYNLIPAFVSILHTFGRSLVFNPHIHIILLDGGISNITNSFVSVNFFSYPSFRKRWMKVLLDLLEKDIGKQKFRKLKNDLYLRYKDGFYVFAPPSKFKSYVDLIKYVCRYVARPVMAESRIIDYDGTYVTFWYQRHQDDLIVIEKIHACEFISRIIVHIPDYNFKQIRFYGAYHNSTKVNINMVKIQTPEKSEYKKKMEKWRYMYLLEFKIDPLKCPICNNIMVYYNSVYT